MLFLEICARYKKIRCHSKQYVWSVPNMDIQPSQSMNSYQEIRLLERGHTPTLRSWKTGFETPRHRPTQVACKKLHPKSRSRAWDTNFRPQHPWNIEVLISTHLTSAAMALNMANMPNRARGVRGNIYNVYVPLLLLPMLCIGSTTITTGNKHAQQFVNVSCLRLTNKYW